MGEAPAGSAVIWGANTWHTSFPKQTPGLRSTILCTFCASHLKTQADFRSTVPQDALERNPPRFGSLMDIHNPFPLAKEDFDFSKVGKRNGSLFNTLPMWKEF